MRAEDPFAVLGLDPAACDEAAVKSAYARLLKLHRPDRDPAGFQRVREAYEACRAMVGRPRIPAEPAAPSPFREGTVDASPLQRESPQDAPPQGAELPVGRPPALAAPADPDDLDDLIRRFADGDHRLMDLAVSRWRERHDWQRLQQLGRRWLERLGSHPDSETGEAALALAHALVLLDGELAAKLADRGFALASGTNRRQMSHDLDALLRVGGNLGKLTFALRCELMTALERGGLEGSAEDFPKRLRAGLATIRREPLTYQFLRGRLPMLWEDPAAAPPAPVVRSKRARAAPASAWPRVFVFIVVFAFIGRVASCSRESTRVPGYAEGPAPGWNQPAPGQRPADPWNNAPNRFQGFPPPPPQPAPFPMPGGGSPRR